MGACSEEKITAKLMSKIDAWNLYLIKIAYVFGAVQHSSSKG
jgi:hypothetical protein